MKTAQQSLTGADDIMCVEAHVVPVGFLICFGPLNMGWQDVRTFLETP